MANTDFILGNNALHGQVRVLTAILGKFVACASRTLSMRQLREHTGVPERQLSKMCSALVRAALLQPQSRQPASWKLACNASEVTLEDVVRCALTLRTARSSRSRAAVTHAAAIPAEDSIARDVDLLVMQATVSINQSICQHLRKFPLDRLTFSAAASPPNGKDAISLPYSQIAGWPASAIPFS